MDCIRKIFILNEICFLFLIFYFSIYRKDNMPVIEKMEIEVHKRGKFLGAGGINLKKLLVETGVQVIFFNRILNN